MSVFEDLFARLDIRYFDARLNVRSGWREIHIFLLHENHAIHIIVEVNPVSGSLVSEYNVEKINASIICGILLKLLGLEDAMDAQPKSLAQKEINLIGTSLNLQVYNSSAGIIDLTSALAFTIFALGLYKIIVQQDRNTPSGFSLLWWAYVIFQNGNR